MRCFYESPEMEINIFSLSTCLLAASNTATEDKGEDNKDNQEDGDGDPFAGLF